MGCYAEGELNTTQEDNCYYEGTPYIDQIESMATLEMIQQSKYACRPMFVRLAEMRLIQ